MIHLQGMGVIGSGLAWALAGRSIDFTWSDTRSSVNAWEACTGAIYPSGGDRDTRGYDAWSEWVLTPPWTPLRWIVECAEYWYCTKTAPHGFKGAPLDTIGPLKCHQLPSYHLNAQAFVQRTRDYFRRRESLPTLGDQIVVSHGFNNRLRRYVWGWTQLVQLDTSPLGSNRVCVYLRPSLVVMAYAFPQPGTTLHYAGSSLIVQLTPYTRNSEPDASRWKQRWHELTEGIIPIVGFHGPVLQGWRPSTGPVEQESTQSLWERQTDGSLVVMPLWHSGVRWLPLVVNELLEQL